MHNSLKRPSATCKLVKKLFERYRNTVSDHDHFSIHALSRIVSGNLFDRLFWLTVLVLSLSIVLYATSNIIQEYLLYEIRTEIRVVEQHHIQLPDVIICDPRHYYGSGLACRNGTSMFSGKPCNHTLNLNISVSYRGKYMPDRLIRYVSQPDICVRINTTGLTFDLIVELFQRKNDPDPPTELDLFFVDQATLNAGHGGESALNRMPVAHYQIDVFERKVYRRLPKPYPSHCSDKGHVDLVFPGKYTMEKCEATYMFRRMLEKCGTVLDPWKPFLKPKYPRGSMKNMTNSEINQCLGAQFNDYGPLNCPLQCEEVTYNVKEFLYDRSQGNWQFFLRYSPRRMTVIHEVPNYPLIKVFSDIGGWLGFFVGMSLLSLVEVIVFVASVVKEKVQMCRKSCN